MRADDGIRTRDPHLGKVMRYQLRYVRMFHSGRETQVVREGTVSDEVGPLRTRGPVRAFRGMIAPWMTPSLTSTVSGRGGSKM